MGESSSERHDIIPTFVLSSFSGFPSSSSSELRGSHELVLCMLVKTQELRLIVILILENDMGIVHYPYYQFLGISSDMVFAQSDVTRTMLMIESWRKAAASLF